MQGRQGSDLYRMPALDAHFLVACFKQAGPQQGRLNAEIGAI